MIGEFQSLFYLYGWDIHFIYYNFLHYIDVLATLHGILAGSTIILATTADILAMSSTRKIVV